MKKTFTFAELLDMPEVPWYEKGWYAVKNFITNAVTGVRYAWQRVTKGYDELAWFSMDFYLADLIAKLTDELNKNGVGTPSVIFTELGFTPDENGKYTEPEELLAKSAWSEVLTKIKEGFNEYSEVDNCMLHPDAELKKFHAGFELFHKYFRHLWS